MTGYYTLDDILENLPTCAECKFKHLSSHEDWCHFHTEEPIGYHICGSWQSMSDCPKDEE